MDSPPTPSPAPIEAALRAVAERQRRELGPHLDADELTEYYEGTLAEEAAERVRDHLSLCPECAGRLLDLDSFYDASPAGDAEVDDDAETAWRELAPRLGRRVEKAPVVHLPRRSSSPALPWAVAAALLLAVLGAGARIANLQYQRTEPHADGVIVRIDPVGTSTRGAGETPPSPLSSSRPITLVLTPPAELWHSAVLEVEIGDASVAGAPLWTVRARPDDRHDLVIDLPPGCLHPGTYRLRAYGLVAGKRLPPVEYELPLGR